MIKKQVEIEVLSRQLAEFADDFFSSDPEFLDVYEAMEGDGNQFYNGMVKEMKKLDPNWYLRNGIGREFLELFKVNKYEYESFIEIKAEEFDRALELLSVFDETENEKLSKQYWAIIQDPIHYFNENREEFAADFKNATEVAKMELNIKVSEYLEENDYYYLEERFAPHDEEEIKFAISKEEYDRVFEAELKRQGEEAFWPY